MVDNMIWVRDERTLSRTNALLSPHADFSPWPEILSKLASPDSGRPLYLDDNSGLLVDNVGNRYPYRGALPLLIPARLQDYFSDFLSVPLGAADDAFWQYFLLSSIKQSGLAGAINAPSDDMHYQRHLFRMREFLQNARGLVLDVGCDDPQVGAGLLPASARFVGLDPFCRRPEPFRVIGFAEYLPFLDQVLDNVVFNTSLDHILDWRRAVHEAVRVLVPGGTLYVSTLVWNQSADLVTDAVHFHHFREYEIFGALSGMEITQERHYDYKGNSHRHGLYLALKKPN